MYLAVGLSLKTEVAIFKMSLKQIQTLALEEETEISKI